MKIWRELRRRRVIRLVGLYVVGAWLVMQVAATFFPAWNIPDSALRYLIVASIAGFPVALVFGWFFDVTADGIARTASASDEDTTDYSLKRTDYLILGALAAVSLAIVYGGVGKIRETTSEQAVASERPPNSIAVLPFLNLNEDKDTEYFSDGITSELLHRLSAFDALRVLGRSSSFAFKDSELTVPRISEILNVRYLLQGSVQRHEEQIRISAWLVDDSGFQVWSETFDRKLDRIFAIQTDIANSVARKLVAEIVPRKANRGSTTSNIDAYEEYLLGRDYLNRRTPRWQEGAAAAFNNSIELDPDFASPYAGLAVTSAIGSSFFTDEFSERISAAQSYAARALALDPELAEAHAAQGLLLQFGQAPSFPASEAALKRAIELDPTLVIAYSWLATAMTSQGRRDDARIVREDALRIDPLNPILNVNAAGYYQAAGDFRRAEKLLLRLMDLPNPPGTAYFELYDLHASFGRLVEAHYWAKQLILAYEDPDSTGGYAVLSNLYRFLGMKEEAEYWFAQVHGNDTGSLSAFFRRAYALKLEGDYVAMKALLDDFQRQNPIDDSRLPVFALEILGAIRINVGDYAAGIETIERVIDLDKPITATAGGGFDALDFMHMLAFGYTLNDQPDIAAEVLEKAAGHLQNIADDGLGASPKFLELKALNHAMRGRYGEAVASFEAAVDTGWLMNYYFVVNDPRWQDFLQRPEMQSLISFVKVSLDRQRERVEANNAKEDFRSLVENRAN